MPAGGGGKEAYVVLVGHALAKDPEWLVVFTSPARFKKAKSRLQMSSVRGELAAHFKESFQVEVAGIGDMCKPGRRAGED
jgi:hypothetical protein